VGVNVDEDEGKCGGWGNTASFCCGINGMVANTESFGDFGREYFKTLWVF
jgi:hypothetical protein